MGTSAGFFGLTAHGATNGLASVSLSIFNMDHPRDMAWLKKSFETVAPEGMLTTDNLEDLLVCFYRQRPEGPTLSGSYLTSFPPAEKAWLEQLLAAQGPTTFETLLAALEEAQAALAEPTAPLEYNSGLVYRNDMVKHTRRVLAPQQQSREPMTSAQEVGWSAGMGVEGEPKRPFHIRTSANTQFQDAVEKHTWGRSVGAEFSAYASKKLVREGGFGMGI